jgi:hypothetical protein
LQTKVNRGHAPCASNGAALALMLRLCNANKTLSRKVLTVLLALSQTLQ